MGSLPQHSAMELRRYINRALLLFPNLSDMRNILRAPLNQYEALIEPLVAWLRPRGVNLLTRTFVRDIGLATTPGRITVDRLEYERDGAATSIAVGPEDLVLVTTGSEAADLAVGSMTEPPRQRNGGRSWALWKRLAQARTEFGKPDLFFGPARIPDSRWVSFTLTTKGPEFIKRMSALTDSEPGSGGLVTFAVNPPPSESHRPAGWYEHRLGLRPASGAQRGFRSQTHGGVHRRGDPPGAAAATAVRRPIGRDHEVIDLHPLRPALREQHLDAAQPNRPAPSGPGGLDQSRTHGPVRGG